MDVWHFKCSNCGYEKKLALGSHNLEQTLTDLNEDFAYYQLFICRIEKAFVSANIHNRQFDNRCPADRSELLPVGDLPPKTCPSCGSDIHSERLDMSEIIG